MTLVREDLSVPLFEIDQPEVHRQYLLSNPREIVAHLKGLQKQRNFVTLYLGEGQIFFLTSILAVDEANQRILLDVPKQPELLRKALAAERIVLSTMLERVKIQIRLPHLQQAEYAGYPVLATAMPTQILRLQRREYFRIETPQANPLRCKLARYADDGRIDTFDFPLHDISGGGLCLFGTSEQADSFSLGELFADCRLEIPGENVISVNLRIKEISRIETANGEQRLRLGCEFINLPGTRQAMIERYISHLERERNARDAGQN